VVVAEWSEAMTDDRDFKKIVRERSAKTGESYQAARRQIERRPAGMSAQVQALFLHPEAGLVLGCQVESGSLSTGMPVTLLAGDDVVHEGTIASLRVGKEDRPVVTSGQCGVLLDPPFLGYRTIEIEGMVTVPGALRPVELERRPDRLVG
jgi:translation initiation factor IF-2